MELPEKTPSNFTDSTYTISPGIMEGEWKEINRIFELNRN